jgi:hypothetical protein
VPVLVPEAAGHYAVVFDLLYEGQCWWADKGARTGRTLIRVVS